MSAAGLRAAAFATAALVGVAGAAFPVVAGRVTGRPVGLEAVLDGAVPALAPALGLVLVTRWARDHRLASWTALVGAVLTLALGVALYAASLREGARPSAPVLALSFVPLRQLAAVAVAAWAVWIARRAR